MKLHDSRLNSCLAAILLLAMATPTLAATKPKPKAAAKPVAAKIEPAMTPDSLIADARAASGRGETELALRLAQSAIVADPARPSSYDALAEVYAASAQPDFARNYFNEALSIDPSDAAATRAIAALDGNSDTRAAQADRVKPDTNGAKTGTP